MMLDGGAQWTTDHWQRLGDYLSESAATGCLPLLDALLERGLRPPTRVAQQWVSAPHVFRLRHATPLAEAHVSADALLEAIIRGDDGTVEDRLAAMEPWRTFLGQEHLHMALRAMLSTDVGAREAMVIGIMGLNGIVLSDPPLVRRLLTEIPLFQRLPNLVWDRTVAAFISEEDFRKFVSVQESGLVNMGPAAHSDVSQVTRWTGLDREKLAVIRQFYSLLSQRYPSVHSGNERVVQAAQALRDRYGPDGDRMVDF